MIVRTFFVLGWYCVCEYQIITNGILILIYKCSIYVLTLIQLNNIQSCQVSKNKQNINFLIQLYRPRTSSIFSNPKQSHIVIYQPISDKYASDLFQIKIITRNIKYTFVFQKNKMDNQSELPIQYFNFKNSDKNSDILSLHPGLIDIDYIDKKNQQDLEQDEDIELSEVNSEKAEEYFNLLFSPKIVTQSLVRRNQYLEMKCFDNSESEPEEIYHKRKERVNSLEKKEKKNWEILLELKTSQVDKYMELTKLMKVLGDAKRNLNGIRHDYYSEKTFLTFKKSTPQELKTLTKILAQILKQVCELGPKIANYSNCRSTQKIIFPEQFNEQRILADIYLQFLIIPRFFISKQKLLKFIKDQSMQQNFKFLIYNDCLGHYNNEANKKLPEEKQMKYIKHLLQFNDGKERFKKICSINHGGKFVKKYGDLYYELYDKSLACLKNIDSMCKKSCKKDQILEEMAKDQKKSLKNLDHNSLSCLDNINMNMNLNFTSGYQQICLNRLQYKSITSFINLHPEPTKNQNKHTNISSLLKSNIIQVYPFINSTQISTDQNQSKCKLRRINSLVDNSCRKQQEQQTAEKKDEQINNNNSINNNKPKSGFRIKRFFTMQEDREPNIILVHPPNKYNEDQL